MANSDKQDRYENISTRRRFSQRHFLLLLLVIMTLGLLIAAITAAVILATQRPNIMGPSQLPEREWVDLEVPENLSFASPFDKYRNLLVPLGYGVRLLARVLNARFLLALPDGNVLVSTPRLGYLVLLEMPETIGEPAVVSIFGRNLKEPHDMVLYTDEKGKSFLYVSESHRVARYPYKIGDKKLGQGEVIVLGLPTYSGFRHPLKNIAIGNNTLYVSIGSETNDDPQDLKKDPKRGAIYGYSLTGRNRRLISEGIRNAEGLAFAPGTQDLWVVVNQRDEVKYPFNDRTNNYGKIIAEYVDDNPPEELTKIEEGKNYGWPFCNPLPSPLMDDLEYVADIDNNPNESVVDCSNFRKVDKGMEAHSAPLGLSFWTGNNIPPQFRDGALVAMHGSWNRRAYSGHKVVFYSWFDRRPWGYPYDLVSGWVIDAKKKTRWGRPVDTAVLTDGSIIISDDYSGAVYQLYKK